MKMLPDEDDDGFVTIDLDEKPSASKTNVKFDIEDEPKLPRVEIELDEEEKPEVPEEDDKKRLTRNARLKIQRDRYAEQARLAEAEREELRAKIKEMESRAIQQNSEQTEYSLSQLDGALESATNSLTDALQNGDASKAAALQRKIADLAWDRKVLEMNKARGAQASPTQGGTPQPTTPQNSPPRRQQKMHPKLATWAQENDEWLSKRPLKAAAIAVEAELFEEGMTHDDDEFYEEMDKRMAPLIPGKAKQKSPVAAPGRRTPSASPTKVKLTAQEVEQARRLGVDLQTYAANKARIDLSGDGGYTNIL